MKNGEYELSRDVDIDLGGIFSNVWRNKFKIILFSVLVTALTFVALTMVPSRYRAETRILIQTSDPVLTRGDGAVQSDNTTDDSGIASQVQLLQSHTIARKVIAALDLGQYQEFGGTRNPTVLQRIMNSLGFGDDNSVSADDRVLEEYFERLKVFQAERSRVIIVRFWTNDQKLAPEIANKIASQYLALQEELKRGAGPEELEKLAPELEKLRLSVIEAEQAVAEFRENSDLLQGRDNDTLATQELSEIATELGRVRSQLSQVEANAQAVRNAVNSGALDTVASVLQSPLIQRLREREVNLNAQLSDLSTTLLAQHPRIQSLRSQLDSLEREITREARKISNSLQQEVKIARARERDLVRRRNELKSESGRVGRAQVQLRGLEREADARRQLLNNYLVGYKEAQSRQNREFLPADAYVFSKAQQQSSPYFPKKRPILIAVFLGSLLLGAVVNLAIAVLRGQGVQGQAHQGQAHQGQAYHEGSAPILSGDEAVAMHQPVTTMQASSHQDQVRAHEQALHHQESDSLQGVENARSDQDRAHETAIKSVAAPPLAPDWAAADGEAGDVAEGHYMDYDISHVPVMDSSQGGQAIERLGRSVVAVLSPEQEASSLATLQLARTIATRSSSVIVLDMTGDARSTRAMLGNGIFAGLKDVLIGHNSFAHSIHRDLYSNAHIMPSGTVSSTRAARHASRLPSILDALRKTYHHVLIDCGGVDARGLTHIADFTTVSVIHSNETSGAGVVKVVRHIEDMGMAAPFIVQTSASNTSKAQMKV